MKTKLTLICVLLSDIFSTFSARADLFDRIDKAAKHRRCTEHDALILFVEFHVGVM